MDVEALRTRFTSRDHNPFNLPGCINVAPADDFEFYKKAQVDMCGAYAEVDVFAEAHDLPMENSSLDYVISSHSIEHFPDIVGALVEWNRVVRNGGTVFIIAPLRDAHPPDRERPVSTEQELWDAYVNEYTVDTHPYQEQGRRGHYWVLTLETLLDLIRRCVNVLGFNWDVVATEAVDSKVGNGFTIVCRVVKPVAAPVDEPVVEALETMTSEEFQEALEDVADGLLAEAETSPTPVFTDDVLALMVAQETAEDSAAPVEAIPTFAQGGYTGGSFTFPAKVEGTDGEQFSEVAPDTDATNPVAPRRKRKNK